MQTGGCRRATAGSAPAGSANASAAAGPARASERGPAAAAPPGPRTPAAEEPPVSLGPLGRPRLRGSLRVAVREGPCAREPPRAAAARGSVAAVGEGTSPGMKHCRWGYNRAGREEGTSRAPGSSRGTLGFCLRSDIPPRQAGWSPRTARPPQAGAAAQTPGPSPADSSARGEAGSNRLSAPRGPTASVLLQPPATPGPGTARQISKTIINTTWRDKYVSKGGSKLQRHRGPLPPCPHPRRTAPAGSPAARPNTPLTPAGPSARPRSPPSPSPPPSNGAEPRRGGSALRHAPAA
ncbi:unnamed protein product [Bubo scandiacus]